MTKSELEKQLAEAQKEITRLKDLIAYYQSDEYTGGPHYNYREPTRYDTRPAKKTFA